MRLRDTALGLLSIGLLAMVNGGGASAQPVLAPNFVSTADEDLPVMSRPRPEYDAKGIPMGGFRLFPALGLSATHDDNIYRTQTNAIDDNVFNIAPSVRLQSQWNQHMLEFYGGLSNYTYATNTSENLTDWNGGADGRYDITGGASLYGNGSASELHEPRSSPNVVGFQAAPNRYFLYHGEVDATDQPNRLGITAGGTLDTYNFQNTPKIGGGVLNNQDRDYTEYQGYAKAFYDFSPGYTGFLRATYDDRAFDQYLDRAGFHRSSTGYHVDGGVDLQITHLVSGEVYVGYLDQNFKAPLKDVSGLDYAVRLDWLASPLLTVHLQGTKTLSQVTLAGVSVSDDQSINLSADYELLRNLIIQAHANYTDSSYTGIARHDTLPDLGIGAKYFINSYASANLSYDYSKRSTNIAGSGFSDNQISLSLNLHL